MRIRSGAVIIREEKILLMYRRRGGQEYYIIPGGTKEDFESVEEAALREVKEETGLSIVLEKESFRETKPNGDEHFYFLARAGEGEAVLGGEEALLSSPDNFFGLEWIPIVNLPNLSINSPETKDLLLASLGLVPDFSVV